MEQAQFEAMVSALEQESSAAPAFYQVKVAALAALGFAILALLFGFAASGLLLIAGLVIALLFHGGSAWLLVLKLGKVLLLLVVPLWLLVRASLAALVTRLPAPQGHEIRREQAPALFAAMDRMRERMRGPRFHHVLLTDEVNAAVVQRPLFGWFGFPRNYLILGLPLLEAVAPDEALAVVAHEYGHLAGSHGRFGAFIYRLRLSWGSIQQITEQWQGWLMRPLRSLVGWYAPYFNAYSFVLARANEYEADAASAELAGAAVAASALKRINIVTPQYERFNDQTIGTVRDLPAPPRDRAIRWAGVASGGVERQQGQHWLGEALQRLPQLMDTHPALGQRLKALPGESDRIDELSPPLAGETAASAWLGEALGPLRDALQTEWHDRLEAPWKTRHDELQGQLKRLAELQSLDAPSVDEQIERFRLAVELQPEVNPVDSLAAFNAVQPDHPLTIFLEGRERLARDDEAGLALLERVISLDPEATRAACECASAWLARRSDARLPAWQARWSERVDFESRREAELHRLDARPEIRPHGLDDETLAKVRALVRAYGEGVRSARLARRVLATDPDVPTYVLGLELTRWTAFRRGGPSIVAKFAALQWPMHLFIVALDDEHKPLREAMNLLPSTLLARD